VKNIEESYNQQAKDYDGFIRKLVPGYDFFMGITPVLLNNPKNVLDIGCGTGNSAAAIKRLHPDTAINCVDPSEEMLRTAALRVKGDFVHSSVEDFSFDKKYDAVTSVMVMHNVQTREARAEIYKKIYNSLNSEGVYVTADILLGENEVTQNLYLGMWREYMLANLPAEEVDGKWIPLHKDKDKPIKLSEQLDTLRDAGFSSVDVLNKNINFCMMVAYKAAPCNRS